jgi:hypothetical protein
VQNLIETLLAGLVLSMLVFKPEWQARVKAGPRSAIMCTAVILALIGLMVLLE